MSFFHLKYPSVILIYRMSSLDYAMLNLWIFIFQYTIFRIMCIYIYMHII